MKRRTFIKLSAIGAAGMVLPLQLEGDAAAAPPLKPSTLITPNADFYILQIGDPVELDAATWRLPITGLIDKRIPPLRLEEITAMESVTTMRTLKCIGDPIGTEQMSNATWKGVRLRDLLERVGPTSEAKVVVFRCADGYHTAIPLEKAMREETLLAYEMNEAPLPTEHGFPVRLLNPWALRDEKSEMDHQHPTGEGTRKLLGETGVGSDCECKTRHNDWHPE